MKLEQIVRDPLGSFIYLERYCHFLEYPDLAKWGDFRPEYSSFSHDNPVNLFILKIPIKDVGLSFTGVTSKIVNRFITPNVAYLPVHPQIFEEKSCPIINKAVQYALAVNKLEAQPTASIRTLFVSGENPFFVKVHFPKRISSLTREVTLEDIERGRWMTNEFKRAADFSELPKDIGFFPELLGIWYEMGGNSAGAIIRDFNPYPALDKTYSLPLCSLFSKDVKSPTDKPLLFSLAEINNKKPSDYLIEEIVTPHLKQWAWLVFEFGVIFNSHGQNIVLQFEEDWKVRRFDYRDFQGRLVAQQIREKKGLPLPQHFLTREKNMDFSKEISVCYDFMVGSRLYKRLLEPLKREGYDVLPLIERIRKVFAQVVGDNKKHFKNTRIYYKGLTTEWRQVDTGMAPKYR